MQKALVVLLNVMNAHSSKPEGKMLAERAHCLDELNRHLAEGWRVVHSYAMGGTDTYYASSLVILERDDGASA